LGVSSADPTLANGLPKSRIRVDGPWLVIAWPEMPIIRLDARLLDRIAAMDHDLCLQLGDLTVAIHVADGPRPAARIVELLAPFTRHAPITRAEVYEDAKRRLMAHEAGRVHACGSAALVAEDAITVQGDYLIVGRAAFRRTDVSNYAAAGWNLPLPTGGVLQAAIGMLILRAQQRFESAEDIVLLSKRIADYEANNLAT
jgi:hypothetical protein